MKEEENWRKRTDEERQDINYFSQPAILFEFLLVEVDWGF